MQRDAGIPLIIPTPSGYQFARQIAQHLQTKYLKERTQQPNSSDVWVPTEITVFGDTDHIANINRHIRDEDIYIVADVFSHAVGVPAFPDGEHRGYTIRMKQDTYLLLDGKGEPLQIQYQRQTIGDNFDTLCTVIDSTCNALKGGGRINVVIPCFPSARQDRRGGRRSLDLERRIRMLANQGAQHLVVIDIHNPSAAENAVGNRMGFDHLYAAYTFIKNIDSTLEKYGNLFFISPDYGALERNEVYSDHFKVGSAFIDKRRSKSPNTLEMGAVRLRGVEEAEIKDKDVIAVDDMIDTAGSIVKEARFVKEKGASSFRAITTHPVFSYPAIERLREAHEKGVLDEVIVSNSVTLSDEIKKESWLTVIDISQYFAKAINRLNQGESVSELLEDVS